jgi:hypothetical protein
VKTWAHSTSEAGLPASKSAAQRIPTGQQV